MIADRSSGAKAHSCANFPHRRCIPILLHELIHIFQNPLRFIAGSGHNIDPLSKVYFDNSTNERKRKDLSDKKTEKYSRSPIYYTERL
jgi:hypothetical protein